MEHQVSTEAAPLTPEQVRALIDELAAHTARAESELRAFYVRYRHRRRRLLLVRVVGGALNFGCLMFSFATENHPMVAVSVVALLVLASAPSLPKNPLDLLRRNGEIVPDTMHAMMQRVIREN